MSGLGKQKRKRAVSRSRMMGATEEELHAADVWRRPPAGELAPADKFTVPVGGEPISEQQLKIRLVRSALTWELVEFSIVLRARVGGRWREIAEIDSCHDVDFHLHQNGKSVDRRVSDPVILGTISSIEDVDEAYGVALSKFEQEWDTFLGRWHHG